MRFKITAHDDNGDSSIHFFDNQTLDITTQDNIPVVLKEDPRCSALLDDSYSDYSLDELVYKDPSQIKDLRINLGFNCNFHCKYCYETTKSNTNHTTIAIKEDYQTKATKLVQRVSKVLNNLKQVTFWGGEPLVYLKLIKHLIPQFKNAYHDIQFCTITNGSLLNIDTAKYLIDNKVHVTISHDGPSFKYYRNDQDPLDNPTSLAGIKYLFANDSTTTFNMVVTPQNADLQQIIPFFERKLGFTPQIHFESIVKLTSQTKDIITPFDSETTRVMLNNIVAYGSTPTRDHPYGTVRDNVSAILRRLINQRPIQDTDCMILAKNYLAIDVDGNLMVCHSNNKYYGTLETISTSKIGCVHSWHDRDNCKQCPFLVSCRGGCTINDNTEHEIFCQTAKMWHAGFFIAAWKILFNETICRIEPVMED